MTTMHRRAAPLVAMLAFAVSSLHAQTAIYGAGLQAWSATSGDGNLTTRTGTMMLHLTGTSPVSGTITALLPHNATSTMDVTLSATF